MALCLPYSHRSGWVARRKRLGVPTSGKSGSAGRFCSGLNRAKEKSQVIFARKRCVQLLGDWPPGEASSPCPPSPTTSGVCRNKRLKASSTCRSDKRPVMVRVWPLPWNGTSCQGRIFEGVMESGQVHLSTGFRANSEPGMSPADRRPEDTAKLANRHRIA